jgi:hypothetical protein
MNLARLFIGRAKQADPGMGLSEVAAVLYVVFDGDEFIAYSTVRGAPAELLDKLGASVPSAFREGRVQGLWAEWLQTEEGMKYRPAAKSNRGKAKKRKFSF